MRLRRGGEETTPVEIITDDAGWADATPVTTASDRRGRWPEGILLAAVIAVVLGIGATSGSDSEDATDMPRSTTTTARRSTATTRPRPSTSTTTWPVQVAGIGPVLGSDAAPTNTALVVVEERGALAVLDLDTGDVCRTADGPSSWFPTPQRGLTDEVIVGSDSGRSMIIDSTCGLRPANRGEVWSVQAVTETTYWRTTDTAVQELVEHAIADDAELRRIPVPALTGIVADGSWMVVAAAGELVAIDLHSDRKIGLGSGHPVAIGGGTLVAIRCKALECEPVAIDVATGRSRRLPIPMPTMWDPAVMSSDGRWMQYTVLAEFEGTSYQLADLREGTTREVRGAPCSFSVDSLWLLCVRPSVIEIVSIADGRIVDVSRMFDRPTNGFAVMRTG